MTMKWPAFLPAALKGMVRKPATRRYPTEIRPPYAGERGAIVNDEARCILCGLCERRCPTQCIEVDKKGRLWAHDPFACILCGFCVEVCPTKSLTQSEERFGLLLTRGRTELHPNPPDKKKEKPSDS